MRRCMLGISVIALVIPSLAFAQRDRESMSPGYSSSRSEVAALAFTPDGKTLIGAHADGFVTFHGGASGREEERFAAHPGGALALAVSPDGTTLATGGADLVVLLWNHQTRQGMRALRGHQKAVSSLAFSADGRTLASGGYDGWIVLWDVSTGFALRSWPTGSARVTGLAFSGDGHSLISTGTCLVQGGAGSPMADSDSPRIWDLDTGTERKRLSLRGAALAVGGRGRLLAAGGYQVGLEGDGGEEMWRVRLQVSVRDQQSGRERMRLEQGGGALALTRDGRYLITARGSERVFAGLDNATVLSSVAVVPTITVWEVHSGLAVKTIPVRGSSAAVLAVSPDGMRLAVGGSNRGGMRPPSSGFRDPSDPRSGRGFGRSGPVGVPASPRVTLHELKPDGWDPDRIAFLDRNDLVQAWHELAAREPAVAYRAMWTLIASGETAVQTLADHLRPAQASPGKLQRLLTDLESRRFPVRTDAFRELRLLGFDAEVELRAVQRKELSLEVRRRVEDLLLSLDHRELLPETLRPLRAVMVLERIRTPAARRLLETLTKGTDGAELTREARLALEAMPR